MGQTHIPTYENKITHLCTIILVFQAFTVILKKKRTIYYSEITFLSLSLPYFFANPHFRRTNLRRKEKWFFSLSLSFFLMGNWRSLPPSSPPLWRGTVQLQFMFNNVAKKPSSKRCCENPTNIAGVHLVMGCPNARAGVKIHLTQPNTTKFWLHH